MNLWDSIRIKIQVDRNFSILTFSNPIHLTRLKPQHCGGSDPAMG